MLTSDLAQRLAYQVPWLYHVVHRADEASRETIASDGLVAGVPRHRWHGLYKPRAGHVYLSTHGYLSAAGWNLWCEGDEMYAVSTAKLLPARINPDEDHFTEWKIESCDRFALERPGNQALWSMFGSAVVPSYGDWADQVGLGANPAQVLHSVKWGSLAYRGVVPPTALKRWDGSKWVPVVTSPRSSVERAAVS